MNRKIVNRIFIVGCPRSGTTLLQSFLAGHDQIYTLPETHFFSEILKCNSIIKFYFKQKHIIKEFNIMKQGFNQNNFNFNLNRQSLVSEFIKLLDEQALSNKKFNWVEKTPNHLHCIKVITKYIPDAKYVHILRDGKDVVASLYEVTNNYSEKWGGKKRSIKQCIRRWNNDIKISEKHMGKINHYFILYSDLVINPQKELLNLANWLGIEFDKKMITQREFNSSNIISDWEKWKKNNFDKLTRKSKFKEIFDFRQQKLITKNLHKSNIFKFNLD